MNGDSRVEAAIRGASRTALVAYLTGGYPDRERFLDHLDRVCEVADVVEIGVPFSDPMADGATIQRASRQALERGASLKWLLEALRGRRAGPPVLLMSYTNPLMQYGFHRLVADSVESGVAGFIVPDLPPEEAAPLWEPATAAGLAMVHLVAPNTPGERVRAIAGRTRGFLYAVTVTGITGAAFGQGVRGYLDRVRQSCSVPVCAGFGIRTAADVRTLAPHADGVIVGTALLDAIGRGEDPGVFLASLREGA